MIKIAINGFGRIGRCVLRAVYEEGYNDIEVVAVNSTMNIADSLHVFKYDSVHGRYKGEISTKSDSINLGKNDIKFIQERDPAKIDWKALGADIVFECTGKFTKKADASIHLSSGARKVLISAPSPDPDITIVYGVNHDKLQPSHNIISVGSCTTNCLAPVAKILNDSIGIEQGFMTTVHAYTSDQNIHDGSHKDKRRARAAALSMVPTSTGAAKALGEVLPELKGKLDGTAIRVPIPNVSVVDLTFNAARDTSIQEVNQLMLDASSKAPLKGVLKYNTEELVSIDFNHDTASSYFDSTQTQVIGKKLVRIASWYDNEWGFSCRMLDIARIV